MNQKKVGAFLKELRNEKKLTQGQFAEILGISNRTISRWETGSNMPDLDLLIEISNFYNVDIREILDGERKSEKMDKNLEETVLKVAEYSNDEKMRMTKKMHWFSLMGIVSMIVYLVLLFVDPKETFFNGFIAGAMLGIALASIILNMIYTSKYGLKIRAFKMRILKRQ